MIAAYHTQSCSKLTQGAADRRTSSFRRQPPPPVPSDADAHDLFRRAIVAGDPAAWEALCAHYGGLVRSWLRRHPASRLADETDEYLVNRTFERFWQCMRPEHFGTFAGLPALLQYLKLCAHSILLDEVRARARQRLDHVPLPEPAPSPEEGIVGQITASELWQAVSTAARDEAELLVATLTFRHGLKPREIYEHCPGRFATIADIYRLKRNLLDRLRRNETILRACL
jgi:DNA-directed RNA polymerase specialized sigma24 family protein